MTSLSNQGSVMETPSLIATRSSSPSRHSHQEESRWNEKSDENESDGYIETKASASARPSTTLTGLLREAQLEEFMGESKRSKSTGALNQGFEQSPSRMQYSNQSVSSPQKPVTGKITQVGSMFFKTASSIVGTLFGDIDDISPIPVHQESQWHESYQHNSSTLTNRKDQPVNDSEQSEGPERTPTGPAESTTSSSPVNMVRPPAGMANTSPGSFTSSGPHHETLGSFIFDLMGFKSRNSSQILFENTNENEDMDDGDIIDLGSTVHPLDIPSQNNNISPHFDRQDSSLSEGPISLSTMSPVFSEASRPHVELKGREGPTDQYVLEFEIMEQLHPYLPPLLRESTSMNLLYSLDQHGASLNTLYRLCADGGPSIIALKSTDGSVFGVFCSESITIHHGYYGNGSCFLWRLDAKTNQVQVYKASGVNDYWMLSEPHCVAFGGGDGKFGLWFDDELYHAHSDECTTYQNEPLVPTREVELLAVEVWSFVI